MTTSIRQQKEHQPNSVVIHGLVPKKNHVEKEKVPALILMKLDHIQMLCVLNLSSVKTEQVVLEVVKEKKSQVLSSLEH